MSYRGTISTLDLLGNFNTEDQIFTSDEGQLQERPYRNERTLKGKNRNDPFKTWLV